MKDFESNLMTIRELFELRGDGYDVDKNYYIPQYQRNYRWSAAHTEKLIEDIYDVINGRVDDKFQPYFIGGIVLSRESLEDDKVSKVSFEVVDGQQRLTTLTILLACLLHEFKASNRNYKGMQEIIDSLANKIRKLLFSTVEDYVNYKTYERLNVQRSDALSEPFSDLIKNLSELIPLSDIKNNLNKYKSNNDFPQDIDNLINVVTSIFKKLDEVSDTFLLDFTKQLLEHTRIVVTKTNNIETGFLVFEKLNDRGEALQVEDLLKNFLFQNSLKEQYQDVSENWVKLLNNIQNINPGKAKMLPREFLEHYLFAKGVEFNRNRSSVFSALKEFRPANLEDSLGFIDDLRMFSNEYRVLKEDKIIARNLNSIGFKLGYILFLSMYEKLNSSDYNNRKYDILIPIIRLGMVHILTGNSKLLSKFIPSLCNEIVTSETKDANEIITMFTKTINSILEDLQEQFTQTILTTNLFRRKTLTKYFLNVINCYDNGICESGKLSLNQRLNDSNREKFANDISDIEYQVYISRIGNIGLNEDDIEEWNIKMIEERGYQIVNSANEIFIKGDFPTNFFSL